MVHALILFASEAAGEETSKAAFYIAGAVLAAFAVIVGAVGVARHENWPSEGAAKGIMGLAAVLVAVTMATSILTG